jgi:hypothetical protein
MNSFCFKAWPSDCGTKRMTDRLRALKFDAAKNKLAQRGYNFQSLSFDNQMPSTSFASVSDVMSSYQLNTIDPAMIYTRSDVSTSSAMTPADRPSQCVNAVENAYPPQDNLMSFSMPEFEVSQRTSNPKQS